MEEKYDMADDKAGAGSRREERGNGENGSQSKSCEGHMLCYDPAPALQSDSASCGWRRGAHSTFVHEV